MKTSDVEVFAEWFACLADPTRIRILSVLASERRAMKVGDIVDRVDVCQSTVSHHLKRLVTVGFLHVERRGTSSSYSINEKCLSCFPSAADVIMGNLRPGVASPAVSRHIPSAVQVKNDPMGVP